MEPAEFLDPPFGPYFLDVYHSRRSILDAVRRAQPHFEGTVLDVGCGWMPYKQLILTPPSRAGKYIGLDLEAHIYQNEPDLTWDGRTIPLPADSVDAALATEVLEHCPEPAAVLAEIQRVLKPGGFLLLTVPFLWPLHDVPYDEHRYTPFSLQRYLTQSGFQQIEITASGGWDASLAQMLGLWVRRRPMPEGVRRVLQRLFVPVYRWLLRHDERPRSLEQPGMITGLTATARKPRAAQETA